MDPTDQFLINVKSQRAALKAYYSWRSETWTIPQLFNDTHLKLDDCYVNLSIINREVQHKKERNAFDNLDKDFARLHSSKTIYESESWNLIKLEDIFDDRMHKTVYKKVLILGRAGIGKSTLCSKIAFEFYKPENPKWNDKFDLLLWVSLRDLRHMSQNDKQDIEAIKNNFVKEHFSELPPEERKSLKGWFFTKKNCERVIFVLDGLDEVAGQFQQEDRILEKFLVFLIAQPNVVLTSRPYYVGINDPEKYLQLETVGFSSENVKTYLNFKLRDDKKSLNEINEFIETNTVLSGLVNIPIQLSIICYCWKGLNKSIPITITELYKETISQLWLAFIRDGRCETQQMNKALKNYFSYKYSVIGNAEIASKVSFPSAFIEFVAFKMFQDGVFEIDAKGLLELKKDFLDLHPKKTPEEENWESELLIHVISKTFFLHTKDFENDVKTRRYHFIHLTFQEFFAAKYLARIDKKTRRQNKKTRTACFETIQNFIKDNRFNPRWEMVWRFLAGLLMLDTSHLETFFDLLEQDPIDFLGSYQQKLILLCVNECNFQLVQKRKNRLLDQFLAWMSYECKLWNRTWLIIVPDELIEKLLTLLESAAEQSIMVALVLIRQLQLSAAVVKRLVKLLSDERELPRKMAKLILSKQKQLPDEEIRHLIQPINSVNSKILRQMERLPSNVVQQLIDYLKNTNTEKRIITFAVQALSGQRFLPMVTIKNLLQLLQNREFQAISQVEKILCNQERLECEAVTLLLQLLQSEILTERKSAVKIMRGNFKAKWMLDDKQTIIVNKLLQSDVVSVDVFNALTTHNNLPPEIVETLLTRLEKKSPENMPDERHKETRILCQQERFEPVAVKRVINLCNWGIQHQKKMASSILNRNRINTGKFLLLDAETTLIFVTLLQSKKQSDILCALTALENHDNLPDTLVKILFHVLTKYQSFRAIYKPALFVLGIQMHLPDQFAITVLEQFYILNDGQRAVQQMTKRAFKLKRISDQQCIERVEYWLTQLEYITSTESNCDDKLNNVFQDYPPGFNKPTSLKEMKIWIVKVLIVYDGHLSVNGIKQLSCLLCDQDTEVKFETVKRLRGIQNLSEEIVQLLFGFLDLAQNAELWDARNFHQYNKDNVSYFAAEALRNQINISENSFSELEKLMTANPSSFAIDYILGSKPLSCLCKRILLLNSSSMAKLYFRMLLRRSYSRFRDQTPVALYLRNSENIGQHQLCFYNPQGIEEKIIINETKKQFLMAVICDSQNELDFPETLDEITRFIRFNKRPDRKKRFESVAYLGSTKCPNTINKFHGLQLEIKRDIIEHSLQIRFCQDHKGSKISEKMLYDALEKELSNSDQKSDQIVWYHLDLSNSFLNDEHFIQSSRLLSGKGKDIRTLNFSHNLITQEKLMDGLKNLANCASLAYLFMDYNNIYLDISFCKLFFDGLKNQNGEVLSKPILSSFPNLEGLDLSMNFIPEGKLLSNVKDRKDNILAPQEVLKSKIPQKDRTFCRNKIENSEIVYSLYKDELMYSLLDKEKEINKIDNAGGFITLLEYKSTFLFLHISGHSFLVIEQINPYFGQRELIRVDLFRETNNKIKIVIRQYSPAQLIDSVNNLKVVDIMIAALTKKEINAIKNEIFSSQNQRQFKKYKKFPQRDGDHNCGTWISDMLKAANIKRQFVPIRRRSLSCYKREDVVLFVIMLLLFFVVIIIVVFSLS